MPEPKEAPAETDAPEDADFAALADRAKKGSFDEAGVRAMLAKRGLEEDEINVFVNPMKQMAEDRAELLQRDQRRSLNDTRDRLVAEFKLPDGSLISGSTPREMRQSAKNLRAFADSIVAQVTAKNGAGRQAATDERADEFGPPPQSSGETIVETPAQKADWNKQRSKAVLSKATDLDATKADVMADLLANGPRQMERKSIGQIMSRQSQNARRDAEAAAKA